MLIAEPITFVASINDREIFENNFLVSPILQGLHPHQILAQEGYRSAAKAYNDAIDRSVNDLIVFAHQDIIFPSAWLSDLKRARQSLEKEDPNWGVLGCYGMTGNNESRGYIYSQGRGVLKRPCDPPELVQTLDEIVLIVRKSSGLRFDERLPHFHFYGTDICLSAAKQGMKSYAISAFCIHNSQLNLVLPREFYDCYRFIKGKWNADLPIYTTCIRMTESDSEMLGRRLKAPYLKYIRRKTIGATRVKDGRTLLAEFDNASRDVVLATTEGAR